MANKRVRHVQDHSGLLTNYTGIEQESISQPFYQSIHQKICPASINQSINQSNQSIDQSIAVIIVEPASKAPFVSSCMQTRLIINAMESTHLPRLRVKAVDNCSNTY